MNELVKAVKDHALANYETGGWDYVIECWDDAEILDELLSAEIETEEEAIKVIGDIVAVIDGERREVQASEW